MIQDADNIPTPQPDAFQILAADIGNSGIHLGAMTTAKAATSVVVGADELERLDDAVRTMWAALADAKAKAFVAGSVCPPLLEQLAASADRVLGEEILVVGRDVPMLMPLAVDEPEAVGIDRICAALAAYMELKQACVVADFGTAITIDLVGDDGVFMGGTILPGLRLSARSLEEHTAALPLVQVTEPEHPWGRNTREAINNGIFFGAIGALREIVERYATEVGRWMPLVATGGAAEIVARNANFVDHVVGDLTLRGIALTCRLAKTQQDD